MTLFLCGRYAERGYLRWLRDQVLKPAAFEVVSTWMDLDAHDDRDVGLEQIQRNRYDLVRAEALIYRPAWIPTPGRMVDIGMAIALHRPIIVLEAGSWEELGEFDRTLYLKGATFCPDPCQLPAVLATLQTA